MFTRTPIGLDNEHIFHGVDLIVYCEGPEGNASATFDELFWQKAFTEFGFRVKCRGWGSKPELLKLLAELSELGPRHVVIALDRDYDDYLGILSLQNFVIYSNGYSFESDIVQEVDIHFLASLFENHRDEGQVCLSWREYKAANACQMRRVCAIDLKYINCSHALFDRSRPLSIIEFEDGFEPRISIQRLLSSSKNIHNHQSINIGRDVYFNLCGFNRFHGKTVLQLVYRWCIYLADTIGRARKIPFDAFVAAAIGRCHFGDISLSRNEYYRARMEEISRLVNS